MKLLIATTLVVLLAAPIAEARPRPHYGGGHHTASHGGHYSSASRGSSHKGGHYRNARTGHQYGHHR